MANRACAVCAYYEPQHRMQMEIGLCRRYAPRPTASTDEDERSDEWAYWPTVVSDDWCGEFTRETE